MHIQIIAEAGVNHNGSLELAKKLAWEAKEAGADIVKFQTFVPELLVTGTADKAEYQKQNTQSDGTQLDMLKKLCLSFEEYRELKDYCNEIGITFLSTAFDMKSLDFLIDLGIPFWKIPSGEVTNLPYLERIGNTGLPIVMSTGMCTLEEVQGAINVLKNSNAGSITLLHCTTQYPTPYEDANLKAMDTLKERFGLPVGYSDHTEGIVIPVAAAARGATVIEKHFTLDRNMEGPDHKASLEPEELRKMVQMVRIIETALGDGKKSPRDSEIGNISVARKSIVSAGVIKQGDVFTADNLTTKRPGTGISPMLWYKVIGQKANRDYSSDELIDVEVLKNV
ncbi:MAG: N-acetylneuraminate synthase [Aeriscardovia sp.]|nr:N-acetylneuraminate synthase [Aeriscardovia sp.]MBR2756238.1 N-acetylneuraminate synthase [Lachnospiraceae bacterium]